MKKVIMLLLVAVFALGMIACDDEEDKCQKCVDDYCDCVEADGADWMQCVTDLNQCATDNCDEGDNPDTSACDSAGDGGA